MKSRSLVLLCALTVAGASVAQTPPPAKPRSRSFSLGADPAIELDSISAAIKANPDSVGLYQKRAAKLFPYVRGGGNGVGQKYNASTLFADMDKAVTLRPMDPSLLVTRGDYRWEVAQDTTRALADMARALELEPKNPRTFEARGTLYVKMGDYPKACADFTAGGALGDARCRESMTTFCPRK